MVRRYDSPDQQAAPERDALGQERASVIQASTAKLPPDLRDAVVLRDVRELSNDEAARALKISVSTFKTRLHRGRLALREMLAPYLGEQR
ncbi:MAG: hypothetical protein FJ314_03775 [SAR202 cluster bacterium]|nr:hypothetical protein [SAR202 cluster bacterium]